MGYIPDFIGFYFCNRAETVRIKVLSLTDGMYRVKCVKTDGSFTLNSEWDVSASEITGGWNIETLLGRYLDNGDTRVQVVTDTDRANLVVQVVTAGVGEPFGPVGTQWADSYDVLTTDWALV